MLKRQKTLIRVRNLTKLFPVSDYLVSGPNRYVHAVNNISFNIYNGETLGMVGESGCGKTTTGKLLVRLLDPTTGSILFDDKDISLLKFREMRNLRARMQMIFQDPYSSLDPRKTVKQIIEEPLTVHKRMNSKSRRKRVLELLDMVGLFKESIRRYPHEFSGGQRQRIGIARAIALNPDFIVCDEPVSALDVSIQAQIINLLDLLQKELTLTYLFIAHDFSVVKHISNRIAVMYLGKIVEIGESEEIYNNPQHPYTKALLSAIPIPDPEKTRSKRRIILEGDIPSPTNLPGGCVFYERCYSAEEKCKNICPDLENIGKKDKRHLVACIKVKA